MKERVDSGTTDVRILLQVKGAIEKTGTNDEPALFNQPHSGGKLKRDRPPK
jgi:hypothetical protein